MRWYNFAVSIHALLAECDYTAFPVPASELCFNPRTPCGVRPALLSLQWGLSCFNPRTPCGVRPRASENVISGKWFQSTHSLRSATVHVPEMVGKSGVSIHALLAECDARCTAKRWQLEVSIHALLAECDRSASAGLTSHGSFNPRTPCGVRPVCL